VQDDAAVDAAFTSELAEMLGEHCSYVEDHLEDTGAVRNNHYAADLVGLVVVGCLFPELPRARIWRDSFGRKLWEEIPRQVRGDGTHFESSTGYQRLTAELFLGAALAARRAGTPAAAGGGGAGGGRLVPQHRATPQAERAHPADRRPRLLPRPAAHAARCARLRVSAGARRRSAGRSHPQAARGSLSGGGGLAPGRPR